MTEDQRVLVAVREEQGSVWLTLDSGEAFELAPGSLPASMPEVGESISSPLLAEIKLAAERKQVARRIFALLDRRLYPVARLKDKLTETGFSEEAVSGVLQQMEESGLYSDRRYAEAYCRDCMRGKAVGRRYLEMKLREKRVEPGVAASVPGEILDQETEARLALEAARTRWRREQGKDPRKAQARIIRYLAGRGFPTGLAAQVCRQAAAEMEAES